MTGLTGNSLIDTTIKMAQETGETVVIQGFTVIPLKLQEDSKISHYLYVKEHTVREVNSKKPPNRTLFVINVPPYCTKESLESLFDCCGKIVSVYLHSKPTAGLPEEDQSKIFPSVPKLQGYKVAYIVYKKAFSVRKAKSWSYSKPLVLKSEDRTTGLKKWCSSYVEDFLNKETMSTEINTYMEEFDRKAAEEVERAKAQEGVPDEEGWVTVTRHGKKPATPFTEAHKKRLTVKEKKKRKEKELLNFYRFQIRESKREQIATLRKKFEDDKQRIALMKASRKFRPY